MWKIFTFVTILLIVGVYGDGIGQSFVGLPIDPSAKLMAFGDVNGDKHTDALFLFETNSNYEVRVYMWSKSDERFYFTPTCYVTESEQITNVVPGDFDYDGRMDLLVSGPSAAPYSNQTRIHIYKGYVNSFSSTPTVAQSALDQILVLDANDDLKLDLFGIAAGTGKRTFWINTGAPGGVGFQLQEQVTIGTNALAGLTSPHSNALVDIDGDCLSDLVVTSQDPENPDRKQVEIWINRKNGGYQLDKFWSAIPGIGQMTFNDFDGDGTIDIMFPVCYPADTCADDQSIHIFFNGQKGMCGRFGSGSNCRAQDDLCSADPHYSIGNMSSTTPAADHVVVSEFGDARFQTPSSTGLTNHPLTIRTGDLFLNGYPDILIPLFDTKTNENFLSLWTNVDCSDGTAGSCANGGWGKRTFRLSSGETNELRKVPNVYGGTFIDLANSGGLDILTMAYDKDSDTHTTVAFENHFHADAFFLTTLVSNGVCPSWCDHGDEFPDPKPYGVNQPGASIKFTVTDLGGTKHPRQGAQLPQSAYNALHTPYNFFGLGRTNNYIEEFYVGVTLTSTHWNMWVAMMPNAQLICFPYKPDDPSTWTLELFLSPSERLVAVVISLLSTLACLGGVIGYYHWKEKKEDKEETKTTEHLFAF